MQHNLNNLTELIDKVTKKFNNINNISQLNLKEYNVNYYNDFKEIQKDANNIFTKFKEFKYLFDKDNPKDILINECIDNNIKKCIDIKMNKNEYHNISF